jgi:hypothetical protein
MNPARASRQLKQTAELFRQMEPGDRRTVLEILRRQVAGIPFEIARAQVCGDTPPAWLSNR